MEMPSVPSWLHEHVEEALWKNNNCVKTNRICKIVDKAYQEGYMDGYMDGNADDDNGHDESDGGDVMTDELSKKGVVIVGYQGIGKSSCAGTAGCIDLESSNFIVNGQRYDDWYVGYCNIAESLASQGYVVFTSSHQVVRDELARRDGLRVVIVTPSASLRDPWIDRLLDRYKMTGSEKDRRALLNALNRYEDNVRELANDKRFNAVVITDMGYDLMGIVREVVSS